MARREARYWSRLGEAVEGMVGGAPCWARANRAMRTGAAKRTVRDGMAGMLSRRFIRPVRGRFGLHYGGIAAVYSRRTCGGGLPLSPYLPSDRCHDSRQAQR